MKRMEIEKPDLVKKFEQIDQRLRQEYEQQQKAQTGG